MDERSERDKLGPNLKSMSDVLTLIGKAAVGLGITLSCLYLFGIRFIPKGLT